MSTYLLAYYVHVITVVVSGSFFLLRGVWMLVESPILNNKAVRIAPHINDTLLLLAAVALAVMSRQYPVTHDWLTVKLVALVAYIVLGMFALRRGKSRQIRIVCLVAALATFAFMVSVALTRDPIGVLSLVL